MVHTLYSWHPTAVMFKFAILGETRGMQQNMEVQNLGDESYSTCLWADKKWPCQIALTLIQQLHLSAISDS